MASSMLVLIFLRFVASAHLIPSDEVSLLQHHTNAHTDSKFSDPDEFGQSYPHQRPTFERFPTGDNQAFAQQPYPQQNFPQQPFAQQMNPAELAERFDQHVYAQQPYSQQTYPQQPYAQQNSGAGMGQLFTGTEIFNSGAGTGQAPSLSAQVAQEVEKQLKQAGIDEQFKQQAYAQQTFPQQPFAQQRNQVQLAQQPYPQSNAHMLAAMGVASSSRGPYRSTHRAPYPAFQQQTNPQALDEKFNHQAYAQQPFPYPQQPYAQQDVAPFGGAGSQQFTQPYQPQPYGQQQTATFASVGSQQFGTQVAASCKLGDAQLAMHKGRDCSDFTEEELDQPLSKWDYLTRWCKLANRNPGMAQDQCYAQTCIGESSPTSASLVWWETKVKDSADWQSLEAGYCANSGFCDDRKSLNKDSTISDMERVCTEAYGEEWKHATARDLLRWLKNPILGDNLEITCSWGTLHCDAARCQKYLCGDSAGQELSAVVPMTSQERQLPAAYPAYGY